MTLGLIFHTFWTFLNSLKTYAGHESISHLFYVFVFFRLSFKYFLYGREGSQWLRVHTAALCLCAGFLAPMSSSQPCPDLGVGDHKPLGSAGTHTHIQQANTHH